MEPPDALPRPTHVRWVRLVAVVVGTTLLCAACGGSSSDGDDRHVTSAASCVGPYLDDVAPEGARRTATVAEPGTTVVVFGHWYTSTCNDTGGDAALVPLAPVRLTVTLPGGRTQTLGPFEPGGGDLGFSASVVLPGDLPPGAVTVQDDQEPPATFRFTVGNPGG